MNTPDKSFIVYPDQNVISDLRNGKLAREDLKWLMSRLQEHNAIFVVSMTHVDECRSSGEPEAYIQVIEELPAYLMEFQDDPDEPFHLSLGKARELVSAQDDWPHRARRLLENSIQVLHFASGWMDDASAQAMKGEMLEEIAEFWAILRREFDCMALEEEIARQAKQISYACQQDMESTIKELPLEKIQNDWGIYLTEFRNRLPPSYAQLDKVPDDESVSFMISCLSSQDQEGFRTLFPQGFWSSPECRKVGYLSGFAFMLFTLGLIRESGVKRGELQKRLKHFRAQYRDCVHIENAARCEMFFTHDKKAARLARSVYAYSGVKTIVVLLRKNAAAG